MSGQDYLLVIPIDKITPSPNNPRKTFDETKLQELADSIRNVGLLEPLLVAEVDVQTDQIAYPLVCGERRWRAARLAGLTEVPCIVRNLDEKQQLEAMVSENLQRADLDPIEEARGFETLVRECGYTEVQVAERIGKSQPYVANRMRLLKLPESVQASISQGMLTASHAKALLQYADQSVLVEALAEYVVQNNLPVSRLEHDPGYVVGYVTEALESSSSGYPAFDTTECQTCPSACRAAIYGEKKLKLLCANKNCFRAKQSAACKASQREAEKEARQSLSEAISRGEKVVTLSELAPGTYEILDSYLYRDLDLAHCQSCEQRAMVIQPYGRPRPGCLNPTCLAQKLQEHRQRESDIERQRLGLIRQRAAQYVKPSSELLIWTIVTLLDYVMGDAGVTLTKQWDVDLDDPDAMVQYLRQFPVSWLCQTLAELLAHVHDDDNVNNPYKFVGGFRFPPDTSDIMAGKATLNDIQTYRPSTEENDNTDGTDADESEETDDEDTHAA